MPEQPITFYHKSTCSTCRKTKSLLRELGAQLQERDLGKQSLSEAELRALVGSDEITEFLNTRSASYRAHGFKKTPPTKTQAIQLMAQDPNLIKRPITIKGHIKVLGFDAVKLRDLMGAT